MLVCVVLLGLGSVVLLLAEWIYTGVDANGKKIWRLWNIVPIAVTFGVSLWAGIVIAVNQGFLTGILGFFIFLFVWILLCSMFALARVFTDTNSREAIWTASVIVFLVTLLLIVAFSHSPQEYQF